jgi:hypothetical protein
MRLYEIPGILRDIDEQIEAAEGVLTEAVEAQLDAVKGAFETKAEYIALISREALAEATAIKAEEERLREMRNRAERRAEELKLYLFRCMNAAGMERIDGKLVKIRIQKNSRPSIAWTLDPLHLPEELQRVKIELDGNKAYEIYKAGAQLPDGFLVELGKHIRIQ